MGVVMAPVAARRGVAVRSDVRVDEDRVDVTVRPPPPPLIVLREERAPEERRLSMVAKEVLAGDNKGSMVFCNDRMSGR